MDTDILQNLAEVATGFAGFSGVVVAVGRRSRGGWTGYEIELVALLLASSLGVVFFSFLPQLLQSAPVATPVRSAVPAALLLAYHAAFILWGVRANLQPRGSDDGAMPIGVRVPLFVVGLFVFGFQASALGGIPAGWLEFSYALALLFFLGLAVLSFALLLLEASRRPS